MAYSRPPSYSMGPEDLKPYVRIGARIAISDDSVATALELDDVAAVWQFLTDNGVVAGYNFTFLAMAGWVSGWAAKKMNAHSTYGSWCTYEPEDLEPHDRFKFHLGRVDPILFQHQVERVDSMPLVEVGPAKKKVKCIVCKTPVKRGQACVMICERDFRSYDRLSVLCKPKQIRYYCSSSACVGNMKFRDYTRNAPVVNAGSEETVDLAAEVKAVQRDAPPSFCN